MRLVAVHLFSFWIFVCGVLCSMEEYQEDMADYQADYYNDSEFDYNDDSRELYNKTDETIQRRNPKFVTTQKKLLINSGGTIKLPCEVDQLEGFMLIWLKGTDILSLGSTKQTKDPRIQVESHPNGLSLTVSLAAPSDAGNYTCRINSIDQNILSHTVDIRVAPEVAVTPSKLEVAAGQSALLQCQATAGHPKPNLSWTRKSRMFRSGASRLVGSSIEIADVTRHDSGYYTCHGDNGWGYPAHDTLQLEVLHKPEIEQSETFIHTHEGAEVEVTCTVHAAPLATVEWYMNGRLLDPQHNVISARGNRHTLYITGIGSALTHGKYMCRAVNALGEAAKTTVVSGRAKSVMFKNGRVGWAQDRFNLSWWTQSNSLVDQFRIQYKPVHGGNADWTVLDTPAHAGNDGHTFEGSVELVNLMPGAEYVVTVESNNIYGWSEHGDKFEFITQPVTTAKPKAKPTPKVVHDKPKQEPSVSGAANCIEGFILLPVILTSYLLRLI